MSKQPVKPTPRRTKPQIEAVPKKQTSGDAFFDKAIDLFLKSKPDPKPQ